MSTDLFTGSQVRLVNEDPETLAKSFARWGRDSEYIRLLDNDPGHLWSAKKFQQWIEKDMEKFPPEEYFFNIRTLPGETERSDQLIGFIGLWGLSVVQGDSWVGVGLGERAYWGKGYGTDAMRLILGYAFRELNLRRVSLGVFAYNERAIRSYEKAGFEVEGRVRKGIAREGQHWDMIVMGALKENWLAGKQDDER